MSKHFLLGLLFVCGVVMGVGLDRGWQGRLIPKVSAQQPPAAQAQGRRGPPPLPTLESLPAEVAQLKALVPSNSHIMMDVQFHWTNLWWAGRKKNWPLALYFFNESRGHIQWLIRKSPMIRNNPKAKTSMCRASSTASTPAASPPSRRRSRPRTACASRRATRRCSKAATRVTRASAVRICGR